MNCPDWEARIALYADADLPPAEAAETERHLAQCPGCREYAAAVRRDLAMLRAAHAEPIEPAHLAAVRARVLDHIVRKSRRAWRLGWGGALVAAAALLAILLVPRPADPPRSVATRPPTPPAQARAAGSVEVQPPAPVHTPRARPQPAPRRPPEPLLVKLVTDDPNVVIYWIPN